jgi:hypothetical protein
MIKMLDLDQYIHNGNSSPSRKSNV